MKNILCAAVLFLSFAAVSVSAQSNSGPLAVGDQISEELGIGLNGRKVRASEHRGNVMIISFWTSNCSPCQQELPMIDHLQQLAGRERLSVIAINHGDRGTTYKKFVEAVGRVNMIFSHDRSARIGLDVFGVETVPHTVIVDHQGKIAHIHTVFDDRDFQTLTEEVNELFKKQAAGP